MWFRSPDIASHKQWTGVPLGDAPEIRAARAAQSSECADGCERRHLLVRELRTRGQIRRRGEWPGPTRGHQRLGRPLAQSLHEAKAEAHDPRIVAPFERAQPV